MSTDIHTGLGDISRPDDQSQHSSQAEYQNLLWAQRSLGESMFFRLWFVSSLSMFSCSVAPVLISLKISNVEDPCRHSFRRISRFSRVFLWETEEPSSFKPSEEQFLLIFPKWNANCPRISCCVHGPNVLVLSLAGNSYYGLYYFTFDRFLVKQDFSSEFYFLLFSHPLSWL